jgi:DNA repair exonuclease SbcCD ATPase subunit
MQEGQVDNQNDPMGSDDRRDALRDLQARVESALDDVKPKIRRALEELEARVDEALQDIKPRAQAAMREVQPRVDQFVADVQPRLDSLLERLQQRIEELRRDLDSRAARTGKVEPAGELPPAGTGPGEPGTTP